MRSVLFALMLFVCGVANAGVTGELVGTELDQSGSIKVHVAYSIDGVPVDGPFTFEGKKVHTFLITFTSLDGLTEVEKAAYIDEHIRSHATVLLQKKAHAVENSKLNMSSFIGRKVTVETTDIQVSTTKALTVTTSGKTGEKTLTPPPAPVDIVTKLGEIEAKIDAVQISTASLEAIK